MSWKVIAASARGTSHVQTGEPCQDAWCYKIHEQTLIAVVSDGAGTARKSDVGAWHLAQTVVNKLIAAVQADDSFVENNLAAWQSLVVASIELARTTLVLDELTIEDYHATLVGFVSTPHCNFFFQIGDGCGIAVDNHDWAGIAFSAPDNGEYANQTWFYTMPDWRQHLRFTEVNKDVDTVILLSDGAMSFVMAPQLKGLDAKFITPVNRFLETVEPGKGAEALAATLDSPQTYAITNDDKTLLWARRL